MGKFFKCIAKNFKVPEEEGINGIIIVEYIIEIDGSISNFNVIQDIGFGSAEEITLTFKNVQIGNQEKKWTKCENFL